MKKLCFLGVLTFLRCVLTVYGQGAITGPNDLIIGGQKIGGVFVQATQGTPAGNANMFPADGKPSFAIDNTLTTKYRNIGEFDTGLIITPGFNFGDGGSIVTKLVLGTASDAPERDPLTFTLEGTTGNALTGTYTLISAGSTGFDIDPGRQKAFTQSFPAVGSFTSYRLIFPTVRNSTTADSMQVGDVELIGIAGPEPSALSLLGLSALGLLSSRRRSAVAP